MSLQELVRELVELLGEQERIPGTYVENSRELQRRLAHGQLHLAVLGQFKRGKSSLINALLGAEVLPQGILPVTLLPTFLRYGSRPAVEVTFEDGRTAAHPLSSLRRFVAEAENPQNEQGIKQVDVSYPSPLLQSGIVLIDTPGIGSTHEHNTQATMDALPRFDVGIAVLSPDPPITAAEAIFLQQASQHVVHLLFVLNKVDYFYRSPRSASVNGRDVAAAESFLRETLQTRLSVPEPRIFPISALQGLEARLEGDTALWEASGMAALEDALLELAANQRTTLLGEAVRRKARNIAAETDHLLALREQALRLPVAELERRIELFHAYAAAARAKRQELKDRLVGDEKRLRVILEATIEALRQRVLPELVRATLETGMPREGRDRRQAFQTAASAVFDRERKLAHQEVVAALEEVLAVRAEEARSIREELRREASDLLEVPYSALLAEESRVELPEPAWAIEWLPMKTLRPGFWEGLMPGSMRASREEVRRSRLARDLAIRNGEKIRWWLLRIVKESLERFRLQVEQEMEETIRQIDDSLHIGRERHQRGVQQIEATQAELGASRAALRELAEALEREGAPDCSSTK